MDSRKWNSWGASAIGPAHRRLGIPNQDAWLVEHFRWGDVIAVSDGLGSCSKSDIGAKAACRAVLEASKIYFTKTGTKVEKLLKLVQALWMRIIFPHLPKDCSATCLFVVRYNDKVILAQLGDGMIVACKNNEQATILAEPQEDSFSNMTESLGSIGSIDRWTFFSDSVDGYRAFILCTDGIADDILLQNWESFAYELFLAYRHYDSQTRIEEIQQWLREWPVPGHSDDKTLACLFHSGDKDEGKFH